MDRLRAMVDDGFVRPPPPLPRAKGHTFDQPSWVLLDLLAYIADRDNSTSACTEMSDGTRIRVTLCAAPPPLVSYVCVWCPDQEPGERPYIKRCVVEAADADLVFLYASLRSRRFGPCDCDCFVYKASSGGKGPSLGPSLRRLELPDPSMSTHHDVALLPYSDLRQDEDGHGDGDSDFCVALLKYQGSSGAQQHNYELWVFQSKDGQWRHTPFSMTGYRRHITYKAINLGHGGLVGFADPWRGIIVCDVLGRRPPRYLPLPAELIMDNNLNMPLLYRDIALVEGRLTMVELCDIGEPHSDFNCQAWEASTWSRKVTDLWEEDWRKYCVVHSDDISVKDAPGVDLLPKVMDDDGSMRSTLEMPYTAHPMLSLSDSRVVYIMGKVGYLDKKVLVTSVDMRERRLEEVAMFDAERMVGIPFSYTYTQSLIPKYFDPDARENLKRPGMFHMAYPRKQYALSKETHMQISGGVREQHEAGSSMGAEDTDKSMDVD